MKRKSMSGKPEPRTECKRCGICCRKGGPTLHIGDLPLIQSGVIDRLRLITIRRGELVYKPFQDKPQPAVCELIKICGKGKEWQCFYYGGAVEGCNIYGSRPAACEALQCWDTLVVERMIESDTLQRSDIIAAGDPIYPLIKEYEELFPCPDMALLINAVERKSFPSLQVYTDLVNEDIQYRTRLAATHKLGVAEELFLLGRPLFQLLQQLGVTVTELKGKLKLQWP